MKRRQFLKSVAALAGAAVLPGAGAAPAAPQLSDGLVEATIFILHGDGTVSWNKVDANGAIVELDRMNLKDVYSNWCPEGIYPWDAFWLE